MAKNTMETDLKLFAILTKAIEIASAENGPFYQHFISSMYTEMEGIKEKMESGEWQSSGSIAAAFDIDDDDDDADNNQPTSQKSNSNASTGVAQAQFGGVTVTMPDADADLLNAMLGITFPDDMDDDEEEE